MTDEERDQAIFDELVEAGMRQRGFSPAEARSIKDGCYVRPFDKPEGRVFVTAHPRELRMNMGKMEQAISLAKHRISISIRDQT